MHAPDQPCILLNKLFYIVNILLIDVKEITPPGEFT